jgi:hypothetical protein
MSIYSAQNTRPISRLHSVKADSGAHPTSYPMRSLSLFPEVKASAAWS